MNKRNTKHSRRVRVRGKSAPRLIDRQDDAQIAEFFGAHGLSLMPLAQMLSECKVKLNDLLADAGRSLIEWLLTLSAQSVAGPKSQGREVAREAERVKNFETPVEGNLVSNAGAPLEPSALALVN